MTTMAWDLIKAKTLRSRSRLFFASKWVISRDIVLATKRIHNDVYYINYTNSRWEDSWVFQMIFSQMFCYIFFGEQRIRSHYCVIFVDADMFGCQYLLLAQRKLLLGSFAGWPVDTANKIYIPPLKHIKTFFRYEWRQTWQKGCDTCWFLDIWVCKFDNTRLQVKKWHRSHVLAYWGLLATIVP